MADTGVAGSLPDGAPRPVDLVLEGGGVKGIALSTAVTTLYQAGYQVRRVAGSSAGSIVGAILAALARAGEPIERLEDIAQTLDYRSFQDRSRFGSVLAAGGLGAVANALAIAFHSGIYRGKHLQNWLSGVLGDLGVRTFGDLRLSADPDDDLPEEHRFGLVVIVSDVSRHRMVRLPWDYPAYGLDPDEQSVAGAVRASASIPFYFQPVTLRGVKRAGSSTLVDGGMLSNYPITIFDRTDGRLPRWPTIGVRLTAREVVPPPASTTNGPISLAFAVAATMLQAGDSAHVHRACNVARSMFADTGDITAVDFDLTDEQRDALMAAGRHAAKEFLQVWDFEHWLSTCRGGAGNTDPAGWETHRAQPSG